MYRKSCFQSGRSRGALRRSERRIRRRLETRTAASGEDYGEQNEEGGDETGASASRQSGILVPSSIFRISSLDGRRNGSSYAARSAMERNQRIASLVLPNCTRSVARK